MDATATGVEATARSYSLGALEIDVERRRVVLAGWRLRISGMQLRLLTHLARNEGRAVSRGELLREVWGYSESSRTRTIDIHVQRIRSKLGREAHLLETVRGVGYRLAAPAPGYAFSKNSAETSGGQSADRIVSRST